MPGLLNAGCYRRLFSQQHTPPKKNFVFRPLSLSDYGQAHASCMSSTGGRAVCARMALGDSSSSGPHSSVVSSTLYSLRVHPRARELLGDEIQFRYKFPIIRGELNQLHGLIDINYDVKGTKGTGVMRFKSTRKGRMDYFRTDAWELVLADGRKVVLLEDAAMVPNAGES